MSTTALLKQLEACVQDELGAQGRAFDLLSAQENALIDGNAARIEESARALELELRGVPERTRRRGEALQQLAATWQLAPGTLTLASVAQRAGVDGERLNTLRGDLRAALARVARQTRRNSLRARVQQRLNGDVLQTVLALDANAHRGALIDAEG